MVRRKTKAGSYYNEPPYTQEEIDDFYRRISGGPVAFTRAGPSRPADPVRPPGEQPAATRKRPTRRKAR
jgi:hypothetical protein